MIYLSIPPDWGVPAAAVVETAGALVFAGALVVAAVLVLAEVLAAVVELVAAGALEVAGVLDALLEQPDNIKEAASIRVKIISVNLFNLDSPSFSCK
jgi:hypothetical protein